MSRWITTLLILLTIGCSSTPAEPCSSVACIKEEAAAELAKECRYHLFRYEYYNRRTQEAVRAKYPYPLTSAQSYNEWVKMGGTAPSPWDWCAAWASARIR